MKTLVLGASGATGKLVVSKLAEANRKVKALIRSTAVFPQELKSNSNVEVVTGNIGDLSVSQVVELMDGCDSVVSCLGHNMSFKGFFGEPRKLVFDSIKKVVEAIEATGKRHKLILMSTTAFTNDRDGERDTLGESIVLSLIKALLPPHADNLAAADFLLHDVEKASNVSSVVVRPDGLIDETATSEILAVEKKLRSPIFDPGKISRINVAQFMCDLLTVESMWNEWEYKAPVLYDKDCM